MSSTVLSDRDANVQVKSPVKEMPNEKPLKEQPKSLEYHRQVLQSRLKDEPAQQYISPSDEIMSPATQKLKDFRNKHVMKKSKPQTLFKSTSTKKLESAKNGPLFGDIPKDKPAAEEKRDVTA